LHTHNCEEAHIVLEGKVSYWIEDPVSHEERVFTAEGPYVVRFPEGFPHAYLNVGSDIVNIIGVSIWQGAG
jgi:mannose-6-phosphate isomerase-like protein (cupin superfamily)